MRFPRLAAIASVFLLAACESPEEQANTLFVKAAQAITAAQAEPDFPKQYDQLLSAKETVNSIVASYPGSSAAVRISANEKIGPYSLADLNAAIAQLAQRPELCLRTLTKTCLADLVATSLDKLLKSDRNKKPDEELVRVAFGGLPFANIVDQERIHTIFSGSPEGAAVNSELMSQSFGFPPTTPFLLNMIATAKGEAALTEAITKLNGMPGFKDAAVKNIDRLAYVFLKNRKPESAKLLKAAINALQQPLPEQAAQQLQNKICDLSTDAEKNAIVLADCTASELAQGNTYFGHIPSDMYESIYEAASTPEKKQDIAGNIFNSGGLSLDQRVTWLERTKYANNLETLASLYFETTRAGHRARPSIITAIEKGKDGTLDNAALTQAGLTPKNILLLHANGTLANELPAIYQNIEAQPTYTFQLFTVLQYLARLQPLTVGMEQMPFLSLVGKTTAKWPDKQSASSNAVRSSAFAAYPSDADPRPAYDLLYLSPYHQDLHFTLLLRFKEHGHTDIVEKAIAASKPIEDVQNVRYEFARQEIYDLAAAGNLPEMFVKLEALPFIARYYVVANLMEKENTSVTQATRDSVRAPLLEKYPYELSAFEIGWSRSRGVPTQLKLDTLAANYAKVTEFTGTAPVDWFIEAFAAFTPEQRMKALQALVQANDNLWPLYASAITIVDR